MICDIKGCGKQATHQLVAKVWAVGYPKTDTNLLEMFVRMGICPTCKREKKAEPFNIPLGSQQRVHRAMMEQGKVPPDFGTLELTYAALKDGKFRGPA